MGENRAGATREAVTRTLRNPHLWVVLVLSGILLCLYQAWPWRPMQLDQGAWRFFPWLSFLFSIVLNVEMPFHILGVLFFIPIVYGVITLSWPGGLLAWLLSLIWLVPMLVPSWHLSMTLVNALLLLFPVLLTAVVSGERRWRREEKEHYAERERERRAFVAQLIDTQEVERQRIAQEIHDETLQTLLVIACQLDSVAVSLGDAEQVNDITWAKDNLRQSMDDLRRLSMNLRPSILDNFGLVLGVRWLVDNTATGTCQMTTRIDGQAQKMSSLAETTVFRVVQEAVNNIQRHAQAQNASVVLGFGEDRLTLEIRDDGVGFERAQMKQFTQRGKLGIIGMEQRVLAIGGTMHIESNPGSGTRITATVPFKTSADVLQADGA